ncbi:MAG: putative virulence factor [Prevotellaceae bacterium]|jgi:hypothetical protein|nr:putative virulence factor [Prevotellaceae bacterium]
MESKINTQLNVIEKSIKWVKETDSMRGAKGENAYRDLRNYRRKLNKKKSALEGNLAAAVYGESQAGKSYFISALLSVIGNPFMILDGNGNEYDFKSQINPRGDDIEATSIVTRFSTKYKYYNKDYPITAKLLSPTDLILIICEMYYHNLNVNKTISFEELKEKIDGFESIYANKTECQKLIIDDNIDDIEEYFNDNFSKLVYNNIKDAKFFEKLSGFVSKIAPEEWKDVFSLFWNFNPQLTRIFDDLITQYKQLQFTDTLYLPIDAVLRDKGTILDVRRLDEIYSSFNGAETEYSANSIVFYTDKSGNEKTVNFSKPYLCALTEELIFVLPESIKKDKPFLAQTDLLDFPGSRHFENPSEDNISNISLTMMLRRGRVEYLFNKYSSNERINVLLFCQNHRQSKQNVMPEKLKRWIGTMIGTTPEERETYNSSISPLFVISTWFNEDLKFKVQEDKKGDDKFNERWWQRFIITLAKEIIKTSDNDWFENWTVSKRNFQNIYLLRDFNKSSETEDQIYKGYNQHKKEQEEIKPESYPTFREDLRKSFIEYDFVKQHFENPANSWDSAASINKDGTQLIIDKLTLAANEINAARLKKSIKELNAISQDIINLLNEYYNSPDKAESLLRAIATAGTIQANLDIAFGRNPYFFGTMMKELMLNNSNVYTLYLEKLRDIERRDVVNMDKYSAIRLNVPELNPNESFDTNLEYLRKHYEKHTAKECQDFFEQEQGIDLNELFYGNNERVKTFSQVLAEALESYWFDVYMLKNQQNLAEVFSEVGLQNIQDMLRRLFTKLQITKTIAERIRRHVDGYRNIEDVYEMIADISTEMLNKFINSVGREYYSESNFADLKKASENINGLSWEHSELQFEQNSREEVAELITLMGDLDKLLNKNPLPTKAKRLPNYRSYIMWYDLLKAGFVTASGVPDYDEVANKTLEVIINECKTINY